MRVPATPTAIMVGSGRGAELGVLFKNAEVFERAKATDTVVFDKTGTLTEGRPRLEKVIDGEDPSGNEALGLAAETEAARRRGVAGRSGRCGERAVPVAAGRGRRHVRVRRRPREPSRPEVRLAGELRADVGEGRRHRRSQLRGLHVRMRARYRRIPRR